MDLGMESLEIEYGEYGDEQWGTRPPPTLYTITKYDEIKEESFAKLSCFFSAMGGSRGLFGSADLSLVKRWYAASAKAPSTSHYHHHHQKKSRKIWNYQEHGVKWSRSQGLFGQGKKRSTRTGDSPRRLGPQ